MAILLFMCPQMEASRKEITKKPPPRRVFHAIIGQKGDYQADILFPKYGETDYYRRLNDGMSCILILVEVPTRFAYCLPLRNKGADEVFSTFSMAVNHLAEKGIDMHNVTTDDGAEFVNKQFESLLMSNGIEHWVKEVGDRYSLGIVDRACRTVKEWMLDWQIQNDEESWVKALPDLMRRYNTHKIRTLKASPNELRRDEAKLRDAQEIAASRGDQARDKFYTYEIGDKVRIRLKPADQPRDRAVGSKPSDKVAKGTDRWSNKVYRIIGREGYSFTLQDMDGEEPDRTYRQHELMRVPESSVDVPDLFTKAAYKGRMKRRMAKEGIEEAPQAEAPQVAAPKAAQKKEAPQMALQDRPKRERKAPERLKSHALWGKK